MTSDTPGAGQPDPAEPPGPPSGPPASGADASPTEVNPDTGERQECPLVSNDELNVIFGGSTAQARPMGGIFRSTVGQFLDNRVLKDASDCWIVGSGTTTAVTGRIAAIDGVNA